MKKRKLGVVLSVLLIAGFLLSCQPKPTAPPATAVPTATSEAAAPTAAPTEAATAEAPVPTTCDGEVTWLSVFTGAVGEEARLIQELNREFEAENPCIRIDFQAPGSEHEHLLKIRMAANDMPDVWWTHGWGKMRYGSFVADLADQPWVSRIDPAILPDVTDEDGKVYILPMTWDKAGISYNVDILDEYGVDPSAIKTYDDLLAACETIVQGSGGEINCFHFGAADIWPVGVFYDWFATAVLVSPPDNQQQALMDRTFADWDKFTLLSEMLSDMEEKGYLNTDVLTAKFMDTANALAEGKTAFVLMPPFVIGEAQNINPDLNGNVMPVPAVVAGDEPTLVGGEHFTWAVWKDSPNRDAAMLFLEFYARPENIQRLAEGSKSVPALQGVTADMGYLNGFYQQYSSLRVFPWFDRVYLPNGMWDVFCKAAQDVLAGISTPAQATEYMQTEYQRLVEAEAAAQ